MLRYITPHIIRTQIIWILHELEEVPEKKIIFTVKMQFFSSLECSKSQMKLQYINLYVKCPRNCNIE